MPLIAACTPKVRFTPMQTVIVKPPESLYNCPGTTIPQIKRMTNQQVADLIAKLYRNNERCVISIRNIRAYINKAEAIYKSPARR